MTITARLSQIKCKKKVKTSHNDTRSPPWEEEVWFPTYSHPDAFKTVAAKDSSPFLLRHNVVMIIHYHIQMQMGKVFPLQTTTSGSPLQISHPRTPITATDPNILKMLFLISISYCRYPPYPILTAQLRSSNSQKPSNFQPNIYS